MVDTIDKLANNPISINHNNIDNFNNLITVVQNDLEIFENIAEQVSKLIGKIIPLVISIESGNIIKGTQDGINVLQQAIQGAEEVEKDLVKLKTPYLKDWGNLIAKQLEKVTDIIAIVTKELSKESTELWRDLKTLDFKEFLKDVKDLFETMHKEISNVIEGVKEKPLLSLTESLERGAENVQLATQAFEQKTEQKQLISIHEKPSNEMIATTPADVSSLPGLEKSARDLQVAGVQLVTETKDTVHAETTPTPQALSQKKPEPSL